MAERGPTGAAKRPRDRKAQIAGAAGGLFRELGYHRVGIEDIAAAVGITGRAIYRHFANKQDLLAHVVFDGLSRLEKAVDAGNDGPLDALVEGLAAVMLESRTLGVLVQREARHLDDADQREIARRTDAVVAEIGALLQRDRPQQADADADLLARAALAVLASPSYHAVVVPRPAGEALLAHMALAVLASDAVPREAPTTPAVDFDDSTTAARASRREAVLAAAIELFARHGYAAVRMEDVGAAAGIAGPSVYQHFAGKTDLLMAVLNRGAEWLQLGLSQAFATGGEPRATLLLVLRSYVMFLRQHTDLMRVFLSETIYLPDDERHAIRRVQHEYVSEWVRLLAAVRTGLSPAEARFVVQGAVGLVNDFVNSEARVGQLDDILVQLGSEVLGL
ncbi:MAG TPA: TetR family transcriptional regulator [Acidimicrobiales bacterium]|nr:TetR family transcriptional regulator [Acidimicrobiales bacterium]